MESMSSGARASAHVGLCNSVRAVPTGLVAGDWQAVKHSVQFGPSVGLR